MGIAFSPDSSARSRGWCRGGWVTSGGPGVRKRDAALGDVRGLGPESCHDEQGEEQAQDDDDEDREEEQANGGADA